MDKLDIVERLHKAAALLREVAAALPGHEDIDPQYRTDVYRAKDICIDLGSHLMDLEKSRRESK